MLSLLKLHSGFFSHLHFHASFRSTPSVLSNLRILKAGAIDADTRETERTTQALNAARDVALWQKEKESKPMTLDACPRKNICTDVHSRRNLTVVA